MRRFLLSMILGLAVVFGAFGQSDVTINVTNNSSQVVAGATVVLNSNSSQTDGSGNVTFSGIADGTYSYTASKTGYITGTNSVTVAGANVTDSIVISLKTTNRVYFFIGSPMAMLCLTRAALAGVL